MKIYGEDGGYLDYEMLQAEALRVESYLAFVEEMHIVCSSKTFVRRIDNCILAATGLKITQAGPGLINKFSFLDVNAARQCDPQIAAICYNQMGPRGKHHVQALFTCSAHLLDRVGLVLREDRPYQLHRWHTPHAGTRLPGYY